MSSLVSTTTISPLLAGDHPHVVADVTVLSGQNLAANTVIGQVSASKKFIKCDKDAVDGSQYARGVLLEACNASTGDATGSAVIHGEVDQDLLVFGTGDVLADHLVNLWAAGLYPVDRQ